MSAIDRILAVVGLKREDAGPVPAGRDPSRPQMGDAVDYRGAAWTIDDFPPKVGAPPGAVVQFSRPMSAADEEAWVAQHYLELQARYRAEWRMGPTEAIEPADLAELRQRAQLAPLPPGQAARRMRVTALTADLQPQGPGSWHLAS